MESYEIKFTYIMKLKAENISYARDKAIYCFDGQLEALDIGDFEMAIKSNSDNKE